MSGLLVAGTTSDAGKSAVTAGLCRALARRGVRVAPFKAQNMSNNSMVCRGPDGTGVEIGRAQWVQALAARTTPEAAMNPVLLKPASDHRSHVVLMGKPWGEVASSSWCAGRRALAEAACRAFDALAARYDVVVAEGAGSPAEINLRAGDYVNMGLARHAGLPTIVVGDIDRGGVFAAFLGTVALLAAEDQALVAGFVVNKFRGDSDLLAPGLRDLERVTGRRVYGTLPWHPDLWLDSEDALDLQGRRAAGTGARRVAVVRLPRISNLGQVTEVEGLGLLDVETAFSPHKVLRLPRGEGLGVPASGYEIHHGRITRGDTAEEFLGGARDGPVFGTMWHGSLEGDALREAFLRETLGLAPSGSCFLAARERRLDLLGDLVERHLDVDALLNLARHGCPPTLPFLAPGAP